MSSLFHLSGELDWQGDEVLSRIRSASGDALMAAGNRVLEASNAMCPVDTGRLRASGHVSMDGNNVTVSYDTPYAIYVHEGTRYMSGRKFLENAINDNGVQSAVLSAMQALGL